MKIFIILIFALIPIITSCQVAIEYHQSNLSFIGINYEIKDKLRTALRIGTDTYFEDVSIEGVITYDILNKEEYEFYGGLGIRTSNFNGIVIPVGFNFYPFLTKQFGFHIELAPIIGEADILRGSWGVRYRFGQY